MEFEHYEKLLLIEGLERSIKEKECLIKAGVLVDVLKDEIIEINELINKIKESM